MEERYCQCCGMPMGDTIVNTVMNMVHLHQIVQWRK